MRQAERKTERTVEVMPLGRRGRYGLTPRLQELYLTIVKLVDASENAVSPTQSEIASVFSKEAVKGGYLSAALRDLQERGWIEIVPNKARGIRLLEPVLRDLVPHCETQRETAGGGE